MRFPTKFTGIPLAIQRVIDSWSLLLNGRLSYGDGTSTDNISGAWANTITPVVANTNFVIVHNLGRVPSGYHLVSKDRAVDVYQPVSASATQITLAATSPSAAIRLFIF